MAQQLGITEFDVVWQSRSGPEHVPWLEPDIVDHVADIHSSGYPAAVVCPIGFISDHIEVVWDLDSELAEEAEQLGMYIERTRTAGPTPHFASMVVELVKELIDAAPPRRLGTAPLKGCSVNGAPCDTQCCTPPQRLRRPHSATA